MAKYLKKGDGIPFTQISNLVLQSPSLSFSAKGLYSYMCSKPEGWHFSSKRIALETKESYKSIRKSLSELLEIGVLKSKKLSSGRIEYTIYQNLIDPQTQNGTMGVDPGTQNGTVPKRHRAKTAPIINKETYKQRDLKTDHKKSKQSKEPISDLCENSHTTNLNGINAIIQNLSKSKKI